jgi:hypothetical protein
MPRRIESTGLDPIERRVASLHIGGASNDVIGYLVECSAEHVGVILKRPRVAQFLMKMTAIVGEELGPALKNLGEAMDDAAERAFEVECEAMERLFALDDAEDKKFVHAQASAANIAQDILDRTGKRAPTKIQQRVEYSIAPQTVEHLTRIMSEAGTIDVTPHVNGKGGTPSSTQEEP